MRDAYIAQCLRCAAMLIAQGVDDALLLRAWAGYMAAAELVPADG